MNDRLVIVVSAVCRLAGCCARSSEDTVERARAVVKPGGPALAVVLFDRPIAVDVSRPEHAAVGRRGAAHELSAHHSIRNVDIPKVNRQDAKVAKGEELEEPRSELDQLAHRVIGAAIEVHRVLGPGFLESVYEEALCVELAQRGIGFARQVPVGVDYKGRRTP